MSGNIKALTSTLVFMFKCALIPAVLANIGDELTLAMVIAISHSDAFAENHHLHRHYVRRISTKILERISRTKMLRTEQGLNNLIFKAVIPALLTNVEYMKNLQDLPRRLPIMQAHHASSTACIALLASKYLTAEETSAVLLLQKAIGVNAGPSIETVCECLLFCWCT